MCIPFDWISILDFLGRLDVKAQNSIFPDSIGIKKKTQEILENSQIHENQSVLLCTRVG